MVHAGEPSTLRAPCRGTWSPHRLLSPSLRLASGARGKHRRGLHPTGATARPRRCDRGLPEARGADDLKRTGEASWGRTQPAATRPAEAPKEKKKLLPRGGWAAGDRRLDRVPHEVA